MSQRINRRANLRSIRSRSGPLLAVNVAGISTSSNRECVIASEYNRNVPSRQLRLSFDTTGCSCYNPHR